MLYGMKMVQNNPKIILKQLHGGFIIIAPREYNKI